MNQLLLNFAFGALLVLVAARFFLVAVQQLSVRLRVSPLIVGTVLMAIGATLPEFSLTLSSLSNNDPGLALGTTVGSVIVNLGLLFGLAVLFGKVRIGTHKTQFEGALIAILAFLTSFVVLVPAVAAKQASILFLAWISAFAMLLILSWLGRNHEDVSVVRHLMQQLHKVDRWGLPLIIGVIAISALGLGGGSILVVQAAEGMSELLGISTTILGLTLTALTTSLPELAIMFFSNRAKEDKTLVGALVGSSVLNLTLFPAIVAFRGQTVYLTASNLIWLVLVTALFSGTIFLHRGKVVSHRYGALLVIVWLGFLISTYLWR